MAFSVKKGVTVYNGTSLALVDVRLQESPYNSAQKKCSRAIMTHTAFNDLTLLCQGPQIIEEEDNKYCIACKLGTTFHLQRPIKNRTLLELVTLQYSVSKSHFEDTVQKVKLHYDGTYTCEEILLDWQQTSGDWVHVYEYEACIPPLFQEIIKDYLANPNAFELDFLYRLISADPVIQR